jgi:hypothetical protein
VTTIEDKPVPKRKLATPTPASNANQEALFREARRRQRRRWAIRTLVTAAVLGGAAAVVLLLINSAPGTPRPATGQPRRVSPRAGSGVSLTVAGSLAVAPDGSLYVADTSTDRVLVRLGDGRFRVIAGDGRPGFSGDGGPAVKAELADVSDLAFAPDGELYIATGSQILALTAGHRLDVVHNTITSGPLRGQPLNSLGPIAIDRHGDIDVGGLTQGWSVWQVKPDGAAHRVAFARGSGGTAAVVQRSPDGTIYAEAEGALVRVETRRLVTVRRFTRSIFGEHFPVTFFAFGPDGSVYADDETPNEGVDKHQQLVRLSGSHLRVLWQQRNPFPR